MKVFFATIFVLICSVSLLAQGSPGQYFIGFADKIGTPYSISQPEDFLSERSIERREAQGIVYSETDLPVAPAYLTQIASLSGLNVKYALKWMNGVVVWVDDSTILPTISSLPFVDELKYISPIDFRTRKSATSTSRVGVEQPLPESEFDYGAAYAQNAIMNLDILHDAGFTGEGMLIAVIDGGFISTDTMKAFSHLYSDSRVEASFDFVNPGESVYRKSSHGSLVLSTMAAWIPGEYIGTAAGASYLLLRSENTASEYLSEEYNWAAAAEFADSAGADIINSSLGYTDFDDTTMNHSYSDMDGNTVVASIAADIAASRGILVVNSAGNSGNKPWFHVGAPGDGDSVLTVGAVNVLGEYGIFSSKGFSSDDDIKPNISTVGWQAAFVSLNGNVGHGNGTSFASPIMAGAAACLWQSKPDATNMEVFRAIEKSGHQNLNPDSLLGNGIPDLALAKMILEGEELPHLGNDLDFKVIPNPFNDKILIIFEASTEASLEITIHDMSGRVVTAYDSYPIRKGYNAFQLRGLENLANGMYSIVLRDGQGIAVRKAFKSR